MRLGRVDGAAAADHSRGPVLAPEALQLDRILHGRDRMRRVPRQCMGARLGFEIGEHAIFGILTRRTGGQRRGHPRRRTMNDVGNPLSVEERQSIDKDEASDPVGRQFGGSAHDHAARTGAGQRHLAKVLVKHQVGDLGGVRRGRDALPQRMTALGAAVERGRVDQMPGGPQPRRRRLPDPAALIRSVDQYECRHRLAPSLSPDIATHRVELRTNRGGGKEPCSAFARGAELG